MKSVIGIGNALVDILVQIDNDSVLDNLHIPKSSMQLIDLKTLHQMERTTENFKRQLRSGGSAANTMNGLGHLNIKAGYLGKVGNDNYGRIFKNDLVLNKVEPILPIGVNETGRALTLISPDGERTFATFLGSAADVSETDLDKENFKNYKILYLEGYLVFNKELINKAIEIAKELNMEVAMDLSSYNVVAANQEYLLNLVKNHIDILFANEEEAKALVGLSPDKAVNKISEMCKVAIVKKGSHGSLIKTADTLYNVEPVKAKCIDTTGAGDLYATGFLYGYCKDAPLSDCGKFASIISAKVVETIGAKIDIKTWADIKKLIG